MDCLRKQVERQCPATIQIVLGRSPEPGFEPGCGRGRVCRRYVWFGEPGGSCQDDEALWSESIAMTESCQFSIQALPLLTLNMAGTLVVLVSMPRQQSLFLHDVSRAR